MEEYIKCFSCGAKSLNISGQTHEYMLSAPGCYEMFNEVMDREYSDLQYARAHHYTVDAYACQHPGELTNPKAVNSTGIHLVSLHMLFEKQMDITLAARLKMEFAQFNKETQLIKQLQHPKTFGELTIYEIWNNEDGSKHFELCKQWAFLTWQAWSAHHTTIEHWADKLVECTEFTFKK